MMSIRRNFHELFLGFLFIVVTTGCVGSWRTKLDSEDLPRSCLPYCNQEFGYVSENVCLRNETCCGDSTWKYCCPESSKDRIKNDYVQTCDVSWWAYGWQLMIGLMSLLMIVLLAMIVYTFICGRMRYERQRALNQQVMELGIPSAASRGDFDPSSPCAFEPPRYDTLSREPPKYTEIYILDGASAGAPSSLGAAGAEGGNTVPDAREVLDEDDPRGQLNRAFVPEEPCPAYSPSMCPEYSPSLSAHSEPQSIHHVTS